MEFTLETGTNDNDDFPEDFLLAIYDRIQQKEFATGKDHTHEVMEIRRQICGPGCPVSSNPFSIYILIDCSL